jgi:DNA/RNA endonuclease G (NUC1)
MYFIFRPVCVAILLGVFSQCLVFQAWGYIDASLQMQLGDPSNATTDTNNHDHYLIQRTVEAIDYSDNLGEPVWASWDLTAADVGTNSRSTTFFTDFSLPPNYYRVTDNDYVGVGTNNLNRGHLCPSEDRTDTRADNDAVFLMSNIFPQNGTNNSGVWGTFESYCRAQSSTNELLIICGPSGFGTNRIPSGRAVIPDYAWKIVVFVPTNSGTALSRITSSNRVIALKISNTGPATKTWPNYVTSASQIEVDTGFTFFTALPAAVAAALRSEVDGQTNPPPVVYAFAPAIGASGTNVIIQGTNFTAATAVTFDGVGASFVVNSASQITAIVPANDNTGFISVTTPSGTTVSTNDFVIIGGGTNYTGTLIGWDMSGLTNGLNNYGPSPLTPTTTGPNLSVAGLTRGPGVTQSSTGGARGWGGTGFTSSDAAGAAVAGQSATFSVAATAGFNVSFTSVSRFDYRRSGTGPTNGVLQYQVGAGAFMDITNLAYTSTSTSGASLGAIDLSGFAALQNVGTGTNVTFRIVNFGGGSSGTWYVYDTGNSAALDLAVQGTVTQVLTTNAPAVPPSFTLVSFVNYQFQFTVSGTAGSNYVVQATTSLNPANWVSIYTNVAPFVFVETNQLSQRFFRSLIAP